MAQPRILSSVEIEFQGQSQARELIGRAGFAIDQEHHSTSYACHRVTTLHV